MIDARFETTIDLPSVGRLEVRCLSADDGALLHRLFKGLSEQSKRWYRPHPPWDRPTAEKLAAASEGSDDLRFLVRTVADGETRPVALCGLFGLRRSRPELGIGIADEFHGRGVGQALMAHLIETARRLGKPRVYLTVDEDNPRARHVYRKAGFGLVRVIHEMELAL
jgi:RimJ/RimL family protein N-acetyltransferase